MGGFRTVSSLKEDFYILYSYSVSFFPSYSSDDNGQIGSSEAACYDSCPGRGRLEHDRGCLKANSCEPKKKPK
jgi:hypothetical protein